MSYLVLARKYRPQRFEDLVGQEHVTTTLSNALEAKRLAHAYIFSGPRGCGKTTTARILARALNCAEGPTADPCGKCAQCQEIASGTSPDDVLEIDGASNRGIDQIRELRDTVKYSPARCRYRIYIIDEAHQITDAGFNALLKTLEEPPAHAVFMMATTESHKFPSTILSRCQRFQLRAIPPAAIQNQLEKIASLEKIKISQDVLAEVARAANGSLRDALSLLDQIIAYAPDGAKAEDIRSLLGLLPQEVVHRFADVLREGSAAEILKSVQKTIEDGFDLFQLAHDLTSYWHYLFLLKNGVSDSFLGNAEKWKQTAERFTLPQLESHLLITSRCVEQMRRSESPRVTFELSCLEMAKNVVPVDELLERLEQLERRLQSGGAPTPTISSPPESGLKKKLEPSAELTVPPARSASAPANGGFAGHIPPQTAPAPVPSANLLPTALPLQPDQVRTAWVKTIETVGAKKPSLEPFLLATRWEVHSDNHLVLTAGQPFQQQQIAAHLSWLKETLMQNLATPFTVECVLEEKPRSQTVPTPGDSNNNAVTTEPPADELESRDSNDRQGVMEPQEGPAPDVPGFLEDVAADLSGLDPGVKKLLTRFPGRLKKIKPAASSG